MNLSLYASTSFAIVLRTAIAIVRWSSAGNNLDSHLVADVRPGVAAYDGSRLCRMIAGVPRFRMFPHCCEVCMDDPPRAVRIDMIVHCI